VTKKRDDEGNGFCTAIFLQCVGRRSAFPRDARCDETFGRLITPFCESNAVFCGALGETVSFQGPNRRYIRLINQNCHQIHVLNKLNNCANLKRIYWREIGHFAELRYFWPSA
jgi:hypothetical protein